MTIKDLPVWAKYIIGGQAAVIVLMVGMVLAALAWDRSHIYAEITAVKQITAQLVEKQETMNQEVQEQNHTVARLVDLMCLPFEERRTIIQDRFGD